MRDHDETGKKARGGPMKIVYAVILIGLVAIIGSAFLADRGPDGEADAPVTAPQQ